MQMEYGRDLSDDTAPLREALADRPGKPIKLRIQPTIFRANDGSRGQYRTWPDVRWSVDCETVEEALALRDALRVFFMAIVKRGPAAIGALLTAALSDAA